MNLYDHKEQLTTVVNKLHNLIVRIENEKQLICKELIDLRADADTDANKKEIERREHWIRCAVPFARLVHPLELPEDQSPYRYVKETRTLPLKFSQVNLFLDGSAECWGSTGITSPTLEDLIKYFTAL